MLNFDLLMPMVKITLIFRIVNEDYLSLIDKSGEVDSDFD